VGYSVNVLNDSTSAEFGGLSGKDRTCVVKDPQNSFKPFQFKGSVAMSSSSGDSVNVVIQRDTASNHRIFFLIFKTSNSTLVDPLVLTQHFR
ncbi:hypothetical protein, partial [Klebsiella pneumoniae]|uniref:hypothetical protein n=1 Tax=Klebsiella pneumoniae TaxID=573 RepID=UPI003EC00DB9